ncbi:MAG: cyclic pyranopterin monophosphate synthase MoaC [Phycisphaerales bacterium]
MPRPPRAPSLSHLDPRGKARMVDVGEKPITLRIASAEAFVRVSAALARAIRANALKKGDLLATAQLAGVMAAKQTATLIPLCHPLPIDQVELTATLVGRRVRIRSTVRTHARTGVEMEALVAVSAAALTVIDMGKAIDRAMVIEGLRITAKSGGRRGSWSAP